MIKTSEKIHLRKYTEKKHTRTHTHTHTHTHTEEPRVK
jgi:hypothetical protein